MQNLQNIPIINSELPDIINLQGIGQSYDEGKNWVIKDLNFLVEDKPNEGQCIVLLGASGCGKSSVLRMIAGLQTPTEGTILIKEKPRQFDTIVGMVFQQYTSLPWLTVLENVTLGLEIKGVAKKEAIEKAMEMIKLVGLDGQEKKYAKRPLLSGGQLQRVAIARNLVANPNILLLDEPFGALDVNTRIKMQEMLIEAKNKLKCTFVFVTHDIPEAVYLGDEIYIMKSQPACIVDRIDIDLPAIRPRAIKRDPKFINLVHQIEDKIMLLESGRV